MDTRHESDRVAWQPMEGTPALAGQTGPLSCVEPLPAAVDGRSWLAVMVDRHVPGPVLSFILHGVVFLALMLAVGPIIGPEAPEGFIVNMTIAAPMEKPVAAPAPTTPLEPNKPRMPTAGMAAQTMTRTAGEMARKGAVMAMSAPSADAKTIIFNLSFFLLITLLQRPIYRVRTWNRRRQTTDNR